MRYRKHNHSTKPRTITVKYAGECACCGSVINAGETAQYYPDRRQIAHIKCSGEIRKRNNQDPGFVDLDRMYEDQCSEICGR
jgi:hypothetical protein